MTSIITFGYPSDTVVLAYQRPAEYQGTLHRYLENSTKSLEDMRCTPYINVLDTHECHPSVTIFSTVLLRKNNIYSADALYYNLSKAPSELQ
ncbi:hypothetical protein HYE67_001596 [Fusarium culmorum]|uniref:Uncharacterized protein n=1 Tax=Fusarium culmorum TaxID=5516 RepID=A0A7S8HSM0_FUSCU|nr:hypothetical protein HYE67_001596 [Fusarium culmorum]